MLSGNQLLGEIPVEIENLTNLTLLWLFSNQLTGVIQENICDLNINNLKLYDNHFCPPYPECLTEEDIGTQDTSECFECSETNGDSNNDNILDILDIVSTVNCILSDCCDECSDINGDEITDILDLVEKYPELKNYDIHNNKGYGTKKHMEAIEKYGVTEWHRKSFAPCKDKPFNQMKE